jgi:hypothetical protein
MRVREHDRIRPQPGKAIAPVEPTVDHHLAAAVADQQRAVPPMPTRLRVDLPARPEKAKPHCAGLRATLSGHDSVRSTRTSPHRRAEARPRLAGRRFTRALARLTG